jgi:hypothetical protein
MKKVMSVKLMLLLICGTVFLNSFKPAGESPRKVYIKKIKIIYAKPDEPGDAPTLYMKFLNGINKTQAYTFNGNMPLMQFEMEKPDGSIVSIRNLQDNMTCSFTLTLPPGVKDLIISQIGITGKGWTMTINNGPEIPIEQKIVNNKL